MPTIKLNEGQTIRVQDESQKLIDDVNVEPEQLTRSRKLAFKVLYGFFLFITLIFAARVPYAGSYPDSYLFEYIFGNTKYILYLWLILFLLFKLFGFKFTKFIYKRRFVVGTILIWIAAIIAISIAIYSMAYFNNNKTEFTFKSYTDGFTSWANAAKTQVYNPFLISFDSNYISYVSAGLIGIVISIGWIYISFVILGLIALCLLISGVLVFFNKTDNRGVTMLRKWFIHLLGGSYNKTDYDELAPSKDDVKITSHQRNEIKMEAIGSKQDFPPISFLTDTSTDHYFDNKSNAEKYQNTISKFMKRLGIESTYEKTIVMPQFAEIHFEVSTKAMIDEILAKQCELLSELKIAQFNISFKGNTIRFEIPNKETSKISLRSVFNTIKNIRPSESIVGLSEENTPLIVDIQTKPNTLIIGRRGSGGAMLLSSMLASLAY
ncbi:MAG: hypothetical protein LBM72_00265, partial [Mycoplasmataceae bacterium]|nr:hypothetical protein [Mycoplasmataceae bacterium]